MDETGKGKRMALVMACISIASGCLVYYLFCPEVLLVKKIDGLINGGIHFEPPQRTMPTDFVRFYGLDLIWAYSFSCMIYVFACGLKNVSKLQIFIPVVCGIILELLQWRGISAGTGDIIDVIMEMIGTVLSVVIFTRRRRQ